MPTQPIHIPVATYRLQLHSSFRFHDAGALIPYLAALGITDCYTSPCLKAGPGSTHGYDICDHGQLNPELGGEAAFNAFCAALAARGMGLVIDLVPNHMGTDEVANAWWRDVLENGPCSPYAPFFDIDWRPVKQELEGRLLLPILGAQYGIALERRELRLDFKCGGFVLRYFEHTLPINPRHSTRILLHDLGQLETALGASSSELVEYLSIGTALRNLPGYTETDPARAAERHREKEVARQRLARLVASAPEVRQHIERAVQVFNGELGDPASFDRLHELLELQPYRLSYWRTASHEINYRRFFDVNQLAGLRMEDSRVFDATHGLVLRYIRSALISGLRIDHIDGLYDPRRYLERLQAAVREPGGAEGEAGRPIYVIVEKILSRQEQLPADWPIAGTTGYDTLNLLNGVFIDRDREHQLTRIYRRFTGQRGSFADVAYESKQLIMDTTMASELNVLAYDLNRLSERDRRTRDFTLNSLRDALREVVACFPSYRTYVRTGIVTNADSATLDAAVRMAQRRNPTVEPTIFAFVRRMLSPPLPVLGRREEYEQDLAFAMKFQQYTGPVQAKGIEDTAFYRYTRLDSLNEVGGDPAQFGCSTAEFHAANLRRLTEWPYGLVATATHDTKRGEDTRARLNALSEMAEEWGQMLSAWGRINAGNRSVIDGETAPDRNDEYLYYQTLLGAWPPGLTGLPDETFAQRLRDYMLKAAREAKVHTSWITQRETYEEALSRFVARTLRGPTATRFVAAFLPFQMRLARLGLVNSLAQLVLKVAIPGVPDFYQGTELWDFNLVDPDNRRPIDYAARRQLLGAVDGVLAADAEDRRNALRALLEHWHDGRVKLLLTAASLRLRAARAKLFLHGSYEPVAVIGARREHVVAFARRRDGDCVLAVAPRLVGRLTTEAHPLPLGEESWRDTRLVLPEAIGRQTVWNVFTRERHDRPSADGPATLRLADLFSSLPVALLWVPGPPPTRAG
jgi:(1->4)-alpha-D-glucan 1-alpha-D-glucosylmutase